MEEERSGRPFSSEFLDALLPEDLDWEHLVISYPLTALAAALLGGFWIGRKSGEMILEAVATSATERVSSLASGVFDDDAG